MILTIRTDKPEAEIGLFSDNGEQLVYRNWQAHRELSNTILSVLKELLGQSQVSFEDINAVVFYEGPGSFTGLRIGASVANALEVPVINAKGDNWITEGIASSKSSPSTGAALPFYGRDAHITKQKK